MKYGSVWFWILLLLIPIASALLVGFTTSFAINRDLSGSAIQWKPLPSPPAKVLYLIGINNAELFVRTSKDEIYMANLNACTTVNNCWQTVDPNKSIQPPLFINCWYQFKIIDPPNNTVQRIDNCEGNSGGILRTNAALLSDGAILIWKNVIYDLSEMAILAVPVFAFFGLLFGIFVSVVLAVSKQKEESVQAKEK